MDDEDDDDEDDDDDDDDGEVNLNYLAKDDIDVSVNFVPNCHQKFDDECVLIIGGRGRR